MNMYMHIFIYRQPSHKSRTKFQNLNVGRLALQLPLFNPLKPCVPSWKKMELEQYRQAMLQLDLSHLLSTFVLATKVRLILVV